MRLAPTHVLVGLLVFAVLAAISTLGKPPPRQADTNVRTRAEEQQTTTWQARRAAAAAAQASGWEMTETAEAGAQIAEDVRESITQREVRTTALAFARAARAGRRSPLGTTNRQVTRFMAWARTMPPQVRLGASTVYVHRDGDTASIDLTWELATRGYTVPGADRGPHVLDTDVEFELTRTAGAWRVTSVQRESTGLAAYSTPIVVRDGAITVVADAAQRDLAHDVAGIATTASRGIAAKLPGVARRGPVTIYLARSGGASERIMERPAASHASAWVTTSADVVILATQAHRGASNAALVDLVWHELTHVLVTPIDRKLPSIIDEGLAEYMGLEAALAVPNIYINFGDRTDLVLERRYPYARMLAGNHDLEFYEGESNTQVGYHLGYATIAWIRADRGDATLRRFLRVAGRSGGVVATRSVLHMSPAALHDRARTWVRDHRQLY